MAKDRKAKLRDDALWWLYERAVRSESFEMPRAEVEAELRRKGIDPDALLRRVKNELSRSFVRSFDDFCDELEIRLMSDAEVAAELRKAGLTDAQVKASLAVTLKKIRRYRSGKAKNCRK